MDYFVFPLDSVMISRRLRLILVILVIPQILISQVKNFNISNRFTDMLTSDSVKIKIIQDQVVHPQWIRAVIVPAALITAGTITLVPASHCLLSKYTIHDKYLMYSRMQAHQSMIIFNMPHWHYHSD
jgi:hypothetical protein